MADLKFGDRTYRKMGDTWMVQPATLMRGFISVSEASTIAMLDEIVYLQTEFSAVPGDAPAKDAKIERLRAEVFDALAEIARLQGLIKDYAKARKGITLNWTVDRFDNWSAFCDADQALIEEAVILAWPETLRKQAPHG